LFGNPNDQLLGVTSLVPDGEALGFSNQASVVSTSPLLASQYLANAALLAETHAPGFEDELAPCSAVDSDECRTAFDGWLGEFGLKVFRRPLNDDELQFYWQIYDWEVQLRNDSVLGIELVLTAMLQSPHFLYRPEFGVASADGVAGLEPRPLSSWEMASRLSYFFWNTMPDIGLFEAAAADELRTPEQIEAQARRLLGAERARLAFRTFHTEWLNLSEVLGVRHNGKDETLFPDYTDAVPPELLEETLSFLDYAIFEQEASLAELLTANYTRLNQHSAAFYGLDDGPSTDAFETVELAPDRSAGFLTQAGLLMAHSTTQLSSPIHRGLFVRTNLLCQPPPAPPPDVPPPPTIDRTKTTREQYAAHSDNVVCAGCHQLMDPIGLAFENFDAMGRYRETEWGQEIDARGELFQIAKNGDWYVEAEFEGAPELGAVLANSQQVKECVARQWFRFALGRGETEADACSLHSIDQHFAGADYDVRELLVAIAQTPAFRFTNGVSQ
jgi:hypothetical protein